MTRKQNGKIDAAHAKAIAQAVARVHIALTAAERQPEPPENFIRIMKALEDSIRDLSPNPDLVVVSRKQLGEWALEWGATVDAVVGRIDFNVSTDRIMIAEMHAIINANQPRSNTMPPKIEDIALVMRLITAAEDLVEAELLFERSFGEDREEQRLKRIEEASKKAAAARRKWYDLKRELELV